MTSLPWTSSVLYFLGTHYIIASAGLHLSYALMSVPAHPFFKQDLDVFSITWKFSSYSFITLGSAHPQCICLP